MRYLLLVILLFFVISCKTVKYIEVEVEKEVPVEVEKIKTEYINQYYRDSIFVHDSIDRYISGDTVHIYEYKYIYKYLNHTDTVIKTDSIEVPVEVKSTVTKTETQIQEVNKLKWYQELFMWIGVVLSLLGIFKLVTFIKGKI